MVAKEILRSPNLSFHSHARNRFECFNGQQIILNRVSLCFFHDCRCEWMLGAAFECRDDPKHVLARGPVERDNVRHVRPAMCQRPCLVKRNCPYIGEYFNMLPTFYEDA